MASDPKSTPKAEPDPDPPVAQEPTATLTTEQVERQIAIGWHLAGLITEAERDQRLAEIRRRYHGGR